jgi:replicative DNA helicase
MSSTKTLSLDLDYFEKIIIYNSLFNETYLESIIDNTEPEYFKDKDIQLIFSVLITFYKNNNKVPNVTELTAHLGTSEQKEAMKKLIMSFKFIDHTYDYDTLIINTERFLRERAVYITLLKTSQSLNANTDTDKILRDFEKACSISLIDNVGFDYLENIDQHCEDLLKTFTYLPTGWKWLDEKLSGGLLATGRALYVFCGATNVGKSIFLGNIATNLLRKQKKVLLISLEMSESVYAKRISTQLSQIPIGELDSQVGSLREYLHDYKKSHEKSKLIIKEFPPKTVTVNHIKSYIHKLKKKNVKPDVIIIDYINLIAPSTTSNNSYEGIKEITEQLRALSYVFECPVVSATQINRSGYSVSKPGLETTSESMGISHTADVQLSIWTEEGDNDLGIIHLGIMKNRFGPRDIATTLEIDYPTLTLKDSTDTYTTPHRNVGGNITNDITGVISTLESLSD